jgi:hypothetical protein
MAYFSGLICTLAIWLALSNTSFLARWVAATLPGPAIGLFIYALKHPNAVLGFYFREFIVLTLVVPLASLPSLGLRSLGYRLVRSRTKIVASGASGDVPPLQFSLKHLFGVTVVVAIYAFIARFLADADDHSSASGAQMLVLMLLATSAAGAASATLALDRPVIRLFMVSVISASIMLLLSLGFGAREELWLSVVWLALHPLVIGAALTLFREIGYRLIRLPPSESPSAQVPVH